MDHKKLGCSPLSSPDPYLSSGKKMLAVVFPPPTHTHLKFKGWAPREAGAELDRQGKEPHFPFRAPHRVQPRRGQGLPEVLELGSCSGVGGRRGLGRPRGPPTGCGQPQKIGLGICHTYTPPIWFHFSFPLARNNWPGGWTRVAVGETSRDSSGPGEEGEAS